MGAGEENLMVYRRAGSPSFYVAIPTRTGWVKRSTWTTDKSTARSMDRMLEELGPRGARAWDLLEAIAYEGLDVGTLFDAWRRKDLDGLRARLADVDLTTHIGGWQAWLGDRVKPDTSAHYLAHLRTLMPESKAFWRSDLSAPTVAKWIATRTSLTQKRQPSSKGSRRQADPTPRPVSGGTKRRYLAAIQSFVEYLLQTGVLASNPIRDVTAPPAALEISATLALVEDDVDLETRQVRARGTKAWTRDRLARVADWAWPFLGEHMAGVLPGERVFRGLDRWQVSQVHRERLRAIDLEGFRLHDARHHSGWHGLAPRSSSSPASSATVT